MGEDDVEGILAETGTQYLDKQGVDPKFCDQIFLEASELGDASSLRQRLQGMNGDDKRVLVKSVDQHGCTGLLLAAKRGDAEMVEVLVDAGACVNDADTSGVTSLHYAAGKGSVTMVKKLISAMADCEAKDDANATPLMWAYGSQVMRLLLEAGADPKAKDASGKTALMISSRRGDLDGIKVLSSLPTVELDACDNDGCSAYDAAIAAGHPEAAELLATHGAKPRVQEPAKLMPRKDAFLEAVRLGDVDCCERLLKDGVDVEAISFAGGDTALLLASTIPNGRIMELLLDAKANPNYAEAFMGETPLIRAALNKCSNEVLWMLLEAKADPCQKDLSGRTAADVCTAWSNADGAEILKAAMSGELSFTDMD